jgi:hypothetical protein
MAQAVAVDGQDHVVIGGNYSWGADFGGQMLTCYGIPCAFLVELDAGGDHLWSEGFNSDDTTYIYSVATDGANRIAAVGTHAGGLDLGGGELPSPGSLNNAFAGRFSSGGNHQWSHSYGGNANDWGLAVAVDSEDRVALGGWFQNLLQVDGNVIGSHGGADAFVIKLGADGVADWCDGIGGEEADRINALAVDGNDATFAVGRLGDAMLVVKYAYDGEVLWMMTYGDTG